MAKVRGPFTLSGTRRARGEVFDRGRMARGRVRVLFVGRSAGHFSYYESIIAGLLAREAQVELVLDREWSQRWLEEGRASAVDDFVASHPTLRTDWLVRRSDGWRDFIFALRELRNYRSYITRSETTPHYIRRWQRCLSPKWRVRVENGGVRWLLRTKAAGMALRAVEALVPLDSGIVRYLEEQRPDVLVTSPANMRFAEETDYLKAARRLGIPVLVPVLSWDNLSTKGLIQIAPDVVCVWNEYQYRDAIEIQKIQACRVKITGSPFFDKWFGGTEMPTPREAFLRSLGFDPTGRVLLYLGSSLNIAKDEAWFVEALKDCLEASGSAVLSKVQILVRPHPANAKIYKRLSRPGVRIWPEDGALPETRQDFADMRDSFLHADAAIGINTSGMIDSVLAGLPTFTVRLEQYSKTQAETLHFRYLEEAGALCSVADLNEFAAEFNALMSGDDKKQEQRRVFAQRFARPLGLNRPAGDVIAEAIIDLASSGRKRVSTSKGSG